MAVLYTLIFVHSFTSWHDHRCFCKALNAKHRSRKSRNEKGQIPIINQPDTPPSNLTQRIPGESKIETRITNSRNSNTNTLASSVNETNEEMTHRKPLIPNLPIYLDPTSRPPPKAIRSPAPVNQESSECSHGTEINPDINFDFEENSPFQEGVMSESFQRPDKKYFEKLHELQNLIHTGNLVQRFITKAN